MTLLSSIKGQRLDSARSPVRGRAELRALAALQLTTVLPLGCQLCLLTAANTSSPPQRGSLKAGVRLLATQHFYS